MQNFRIIIDLAPKPLNTPLRVFLKLRAHHILVEPGGVCLFGPDLTRVGFVEIKNRIVSAHAMSDAGGVLWCCYDDENKSV